MGEFPLGAKKYQAFRSEVLERAVRSQYREEKRGVVMREPDRSSGTSGNRIDEIELQSMWFGGEFGRIFKGTGGENIEIIQFGHWNKGAGPDFSEVAVRIDGQLHRGSLEIDLESVGWEEHGHGANPAFDGVVLHVFIHRPTGHFFTRNSQHRTIAQLHLDSDLLKVVRARDLPEAFPGRCLAPLRGMDRNAVEDLLESAAQYRIQRKLKRLRSMASSSSSSQSIFQAICEALGFRHNKIAMAVLAQRNPFKEVISRKTLEREACLFGSAGFMELELYDSSLNPEARSYLKKLWSEWWKFRHSAEPFSEHRHIAWRVSGCRPMNHPQRRIGAIAAMLDKWRDLSVVWERPGEDIVSKWTARCEGLTHEYWENHYTLSSRIAKAPMKLVGKDRQYDILGNVLFPWVLMKHPKLWNAFILMGGVDSNQNLRRACLRLFGDNKELTRQWAHLYYQQQGLLQIYHDFCLEDFSECKNCPFPEQLRQW